MEWCLQKGHDIGSSGAHGPRRTYSRARHDDHLIPEGAAFAEVRERDEDGKVLNYWDVPVTR